MPESTVIFLDFGGDGLPLVALRLCQATTALPDRRPFCQTQTICFQDGDWYAGETLLQNYLHRLPAESFVIGFLPDVTRAAMSQTPLAAITGWRARCQKLPELVKAGLCLIRYDQAVSDPAVVLSCIHRRTGRTPGLPELPNPPEKPPDTLLLAFSGLSLRHDTETADLVRALNCGFARLPGAAEVDRAARAACDTVADLHQRLAEREAQLQETDLEDSALVMLLNARIEAMHDLAEKQEAEIQTLRAEREHLRARVHALLTSTSWRLTAPLRRLRSASRDPQGVSTQD
jgi:hypothetical protein